MKNFGQLFRRGHRPSKGNGMYYYPRDDDLKQAGWSLYKSDMVAGVTLRPITWKVVGPTWGINKPIVFSRHRSRTAAVRAFHRYVKAWQKRKAKR